MNIYIAYDHKDNPLAVLLSDDDQKAEVAFMSMKCGHTRTEVIDPNDNTIGMHGIAFLFGNKEMSVGDRLGRHTIKVLKRGL